MGMADVVTLGSRCQEHVIGGLIDSLSRRLDTLDCDWQLVQGRSRIASGILNRQACNAGCDASRDALGYVLRFQTIPGHKVCAHRKFDCRRDARNVSKVSIAA